MCGVSVDQLFNFGEFLTYIKFEKPINNLNEDNEWKIWHRSWEFKGKLETGHVYLVVISMQMVILLDEISNAGSIDRQGKFEDGTLGHWNSYVM